MSNAFCSLTPEKGGNMYYRGRWEYCPEYECGDVVLNSGVLYLCIQANAGKDPASKEGSEYWLSFGYSKDTKTADRRIVLDGGYATTGAEDVFSRTYPSTAVDGGSSSDRVNVPLV